MKYVYKTIIGKIDAAGGPLNILARKLQYLMYCSMNGIKPSEEDKKIEFDMDFNFGGCFIPADENIDPFTCLLQVTDYDNISKYIKHNHNNVHDYFEQFFGDKINPNAGFIDYWDSKCLKDKKIHIYYIILESGPAEIILTLYPDEGFGCKPINPMAYLVNINGKLMDCSPDEGDFLFDNKEEASEYFKNQYKKDLQAKLEAYAQAEKERLEREEFNKHVESLGDVCFIFRVMNIYVQQLKDVLFQ